MNLYTFAMKPMLEYEDGRISDLSLLVTPQSHHGLLVCNPKMILATEEKIARERIETLAEQLRFDAGGQEVWYQCELVEVIQDLSDGSLL